MSLPNRLHAQLDGKSIVVGVGLTLAAQQVLKSMAGTGYGTANAQCAATKCGQKDRPECPAFQFTETVNGFPTICVCVTSQPGICKATSYKSVGGGGGMSGVGGLDQFLGKVFGDVLGKLLQGGGGGGSGGGSGTGDQGYSPTQQYPACVRNTATNTVSPIPCTETNGQVNYGATSYVDPLSGSGSLGNSTDDALLNALNGTGNTSLDTNTNTNTNLDTNTNTNTNTDTTSGSGSETVNTSDKITILSGQQGTLTANGKQLGGLQGDVIIGQSGGMLYARSRDPNSNTEVAGFYGGNTFGQSQSTSLIGRMCGARPWGEGMLGGLISGTFFDGLCKRFGYQVGAIAETSSGGGGGSGKRPTITITHNPPQRPGTTTAPIVEPEVDIWANPPTVRLGTRTYIFWNARYVESCIESGPSFSHTTLSGGASTVPISDASTFTIECLTSDGRTVSDSVRVNLAL